MTRYLPLYTALSLWAISATAMPVLYYLAGWGQWSSWAVGMGGLVVGAGVCRWWIRKMRSEA